MPRARQNLRFVVPVAFKGCERTPNFLVSIQSRIWFLTNFFFGQRCWQMRNHQIDLERGEFIKIGDHTVTVKEVDTVAQQAVLEVEDPDGSVELVTVDVTVLHAEEPVLV